MPRTVAIVQARTGSTRLPAKVLQPLRGRAMVLWVVERAARIPGVDDTVVAIPDLVEDDELAAVLAAAGRRTIRGPGQDVLRRYALAAAQTDAEVVVRITADCPLLSPEVSGAVLAAFAEGGWDYASNTLERTWPQGLDTEVVARDALDRADREATAPEEREHVTLGIWRHPERYGLRSVRGETDLSGLRWTVDEADDLRLVKRIYEELAPSGPNFEVPEILALLSRHPELAAMNAGVAQREFHR
jgi:spore coat polysaccharide biosynthesis protein SpsF